MKDASLSLNCQAASRLNSSYCCDFLLFHLLTSLGECACLSPYFLPCFPCLASVYRNVVSFFLHTWNCFEEDPLQVLGIIGALDPHTHKLNQADLQGEGKLEEEGVRPQRPPTVNPAGPGEAKTLGQDPLPPSFCIRQIHSQEG